MYGFTFCATLRSFLGGLDGGSRDFYADRYMGTKDNGGDWAQIGTPIDSDIWSLGCVLFEMLTGTSAFGRETVTDTIVAVVGVLAAGAFALYLAWNLWQLRALHFWLQHRSVADRAWVLGRQRTALAA